MGRGGEATDERPADDVVAQAAIGTGEIIVNADLTAGRGPAAAAAPGQTVVPISDPLVTQPAVGLDVAVFSDGVVLAASGRIVLVDAEVVYVGPAPGEFHGVEPSRTVVADRGPGDGYLFDSRLPHRFRNASGAPCEIVSACTPPTF